MITDATGQVLERQSYDAYGTRRVAADWTTPLTAITSLLSTRGFTGHEQLDGVELVHMNGRVYDPQLGRFLSADPIVQYPEGAQGLNRYSYVDNNPLSRVDPSGYGYLSDWWKSATKAVKKLFDNDIFRAVAGIAAAAFTYGYVGWLTSSPFWGSLAGGFAGGAISSGNLEGGLIGAGSALLFMPLHGLDPGVGKTLLHGTVGGIRSRLLGGDFREGFLSAGVTQSLTGSIGGIKPLEGRIAAAAIVGGTAAELGGGKFANGARTFAFLRLFGEAADYYRRKVGYDIDMGPGGDAVQKSLTSPPVEGANNIGEQGLPVDNPCFFCEGGPVSRAANQLWGVNAVGGFHDTLQISMGNSVWRDVLNVPGMGVAAGVTYSGFIGQTLNSAGPMMVPIRDDDRRGGYQWVMYAP